ncbi:MAG TPA: adenylate/guanylate cyclase domain-containing protein [Anaerolineae bacterium]|jgi:class 3 adenylate cyclase
MNENQLTALRTELELKQKELDLVMAIDHIRDTNPEPVAMLSAIANLLADRLEADLCLMSLLEPGTGTATLKAVSERSHHFGQLGQIITRELAERAIALDQVTVWAGQEVLSARDREDLPDNLQLAAVPIIMGDKQRLGALLLARSQAAFGPPDIQLLKTAEDHIDSAVIQCYAYYELQQHVKELETIYRIDHIRDQNLPFDDMLNVVIKELCSVIAAEIGFVMLYDQAGKQLEMRAATNEDLFKVSANYELVGRIANESLQETTLVCHNDLGESLRSVMCLPLILNDQIIGIIGVANSHALHGFSSDDRHMLIAIGSQMDTAIFESLEQRRLRQVLGRSVDPRVMQRLLASPDLDFLKGERSVLTMLYADIRGSTQLAEETDPELLVGFINHYLGRMTEIILAHEGTLDKFVGDEVVALFGAPFPQEDHALQAIRVGLAMQLAHREIVEIWQERGVEAAPIGIGIATGELIVGEMGSSQRSDYTAIGRAANLGARICSAAKGDQVLISQATFDLVKDEVEATPITGLQLKGVAGDVTAFEVTRIFE